MAPASILQHWYGGSPLDVLVQAGEALACLLTAFVCGWIVGLDRERRHRPAGLRTNILVCVGAAGFVYLGEAAYQRGGLGEMESLNRLIQAVATGIGFLGAGAIFRDANRVRGVTTAAGVWVMGAAGCAAGAGALHLALALAVLTYVVLRHVRRLEDRVADDQE